MHKKINLTFSKNGLIRRARETRTGIISEESKCGRTDAKPVKAEQAIFGYSPASLSSNPSVRALSTLSPCFDI